MELIIHKVHLPMRQWIKTAHEDIRFRDTIIIELRDAGHTFWSEAPGFQTAGYLPETHDQLWQRFNQLGVGILEAFTQHQVPNYLTQFDDQPLFRFALEALFCQWAAMQVNQSLPDYLGISAQPIQGSAMVGICSAVEDYQRYFKSVLDLGYRGIKLKVTPKNMSIVSQVIDEACLQFDHVCLDANGSFDRSTLPLLLDLPLGVFIEQPVMDRSLLLQFIAQSRHFVLLDEVIRTPQDLDAFQDMSVGIMLKPVRCGGLKNTISMINSCQQRSLKCGVSGYLDSGVGRYFQWLLAQHAGLDLRPDFVWSDYYFERDVCQIQSELNITDPFPVVNSAAFIESRSFKN